MKFLPVEAIHRAVTARPEWPYLRAEAEATWEAKQHADAAFMQAQAALTVLYQQETQRLIEDMTDDQDEP